MARLALLTLVPLLLLTSLPAAAVTCHEGDTITGPAGVADGDTLLFVLTDPGQLERFDLDRNVLSIRLQGVAAPEDGRDPAPGGPEATAAMVGLVMGQTVACELDGTSTWGRCVAICRVAGRDIALELVSDGLARDCPRYSGGRYQEAEQAAADSGAAIRQTYTLPGYCRVR